MSSLSPSVLPLHLAGRERLASTQPSVRPPRPLLGQGQGFPRVPLAGSRFPRAARCVQPVLSAQRSCLAAWPSQSRGEQCAPRPRQPAALSAKHSGAPGAGPSLHFTLEHAFHRSWQNIHGGVYLGSKSEKCCFPLRGVERWDLCEPPDLFPSSPARCPVRRGSSSGWLRGAASSAEPPPSQPLPVSRAK